MLSTLPPELHQAAERYLTCELVTIDAAGRPIVWPVTPYFRADVGCIDVTTGVGRTGVVGLLRNGAGPTVMLRTELDALPVAEKTGAPFASTA